MTDSAGDVHDDVAAEADDDLDDAADDQEAGALAKGVLTYLARMIVDSPDDVVIEVEQSRRGVMLRLHVAADDMGKVIGRRGRVARALRTVVAAAGEQEGIRAQVDIVD